jgi:hypothetical protein
MSWSELATAGGFGIKEYWSKLSVDGGGMHLHTTPSVEDILGYTSEDMSELPPQWSLKHVRVATDFGFDNVTSWDVITSAYALRS